MSDSESEYESGETDSGSGEDESDGESEDSGEEDESEEEDDKRSRRRRREESESEEESSSSSEEESEEEDEPTVKHNVLSSTKELDELLNVAEDSIAFAIKNFPKRAERHKVYEELKGYIDDLVQDFKASVSEVDRCFNILVDIQMKKVEDLSKKVPILFNKTLDFSRSIGLKEFQQVCSKTEEKENHLEKKRHDSYKIDYRSEEDKDIQEKCKGREIDYNVFEDIGMKIGEEDD